MSQAGWVVEEGIGNRETIAGIAVVVGASTPQFSVTHLFDIISSELSVQKSYTGSFKFALVRVLTSLTLANNTNLGFSLAFSQPPTPAFMI